MPTQPTAHKPPGPPNADTRLESKRRTGRPASPTTNTASVLHALHAKALDLFDPPELPVCSWAKRTRGYQRCGSKGCLSCEIAKGRLWAFRALDLLEVAHQEGLRARHLTVTGPSLDGPPMHLADFQRAFDRLSCDLRRRSLRWQRYVSALACDPVRGHLHRHLLVVGGPFIPSSVLQERSAAAGLGHADLRLVQPTDASRVNRANYIGCNGLHFALTHADSAPRIQPFSRSR